MVGGGKSHEVPRGLLKCSDVMLGRSYRLRAKAMPFGDAETRRSRRYGHSQWHDRTISRPIWNHRLSTTLCSANNAHGADIVVAGKLLDLVYPIVIPPSRSSALPPSLRTSPSLLRVPTISEKYRLGSASSKSDRLFGNQHWLSGIQLALLPTAKRSFSANAVSHSVRCTPTPHLGSKTRGCWDDVVEAVGSEKDSQHDLKLLNESIVPWWTLVGSITLVCCAETKVARRTFLAFRIDRALETGELHVVVECLQAEWIRDTLLDTLDRSIRHVGAELDERPVSRLTQSGLRIDLEIGCEADQGIV